MTNSEALEIVAHAARRFAQEIADDPDSTESDKAMEQEIWDALNVLSIEI